MTAIDRGLGKRWFEEVWNQGRREAIAEMLASDCVIHDGGLDTHGPEGFYPFFDRIRATFSDVHITVDDTLAEGNTLCVRWSFVAKHTGNGLGVPPTRRTINVTGITIVRISDGKVVEAWQNWDMLGMMEQIKGVGKSATYIGAS
jgi:steroid delta-isomerase-like uncharacterized protein